MQKPHVLIIMSDQHRSDALGCYGSPFVRTPNLDRLANEGVRFQNAFTPFPVCTPARGSLWTGLYPHRTGITDNVYGIDSTLEKPGASYFTLFDALKAAQYATAYFGKWHLGDNKPKFIDQWSAFNSAGGHWQDGIPPFQEGQYKPEMLTDQVIEYLDSWADSQPQAAVVSYYPPHDPYTAPQRFFDSYRGKVPAAGYYASVTAIDDCIGRIIETLRERKLLDSTIVVYLSDHGDTLRMREGAHKFFCTEDSIHVPLIMRLPGARMSGRVVSGDASLLDIFPTLASICGLNPPEKFDGHDLSPMLEGTADVVRQQTYIQSVTRNGRIPLRCLRTSRWKLVVALDGEHSLHDLQFDAEEEFNLIGGPSDDAHGVYRRLPDYSAKVLELLATMEECANKFEDRYALQLIRRVTKFYQPDA